MHLDLDDAVALTGFAAPTLDVEAEAAGGIAARLGLWQFGEPVADGGEGAGIGRRVGTRRAPNRALVDIDHLVEIFQPLNPVVRRGMFARLGQLARGRLEQGLDGEGGFAAARYAGDAGQGAQRNLGGHVLQIVAARANHFQPAVVAGLATARRDGDVFHPAKIFSGQAFLVGDDLSRRALCDDMAAMHAGARTHVDHMVGGADGVLVMLDHQHGVAHVAQALEGFQQLAIVALVQADAGLVQHIEYAGQARTDLGGQPDTLAFAARQRAGVARHGEVIQADIVEEFQPGADLLEDAHRDFALLRRQLLVDVTKPAVGITDRLFADLADMQPTDLHRQGLGLQAIAAAHLAGRFGLETLQVLLHPGAIGFAIAPVHVGNDAFEFLLGVVTAHAIVIGELDHLFARAMQDHGLRLLGQIFEGLVHGEFVVPRQRFQGLEVIGRGGLGPRRDGAFLQAQRRVGHHQRLVKIILYPQPVALRAGAMGIVEGKEARLDFRNGEA